MPSALLQVSQTSWTSAFDPSQVFSQSLETITRLTPPAIESTWVPYAVGLVTSYDGKNRGAAGSTANSVTSTFAVVAVLPI